MMTAEAAGASTAVMVRHSSRGIVGTLSVVLLLCLSPTPAYACVWNFLDWFNPLPPCTVQDSPSQYRMNEVNDRIRSKLAVIAEEVKEVRAEIAGWKSAVQTARSFQATLVRTYGALSANPLPSLLAAYNRTPMANFLKIQPNGTFTISTTPFSFRQIADSIWTAFQDTTSLVHLYRKAWATTTALPGLVFRDGTLLEQQVTALGDYETYTRPILDSLAAIGDRTAQRYAGHAEVMGLAEAHISNLAATLSHSRSTAFEAQTQSLSAKIQALTAATDKRRALDQWQTTQLQTVGW